MWPKTIYFVTGNPGKAKEASQLLGNVQQLDIDLPEIQSMDPKEIIRFKLEEALKVQKEHVIVEDTSLALEGMGGFPGPLIKWMLASLGDQGLADLAAKTPSPRACAVAHIGYAVDIDQIHFFEGRLEGELVMPRGKGGFGFDKIFQVEGSVKTLAEMSLEDKNRVSHRSKAYGHLKEFLGS